MSIRMRGTTEGWYLRTKVGAAKGKQAEIFLGLYGERSRKEAVRAAARILRHRIKVAAQTKALATAVDSHVEHLRRAGVDTTVKNVPTLGVWAKTYQATYTPLKAKRQHGRDATILRTWLAFPFDTTRRWADAKLTEIKDAHCLSGLAHRRSLGTLNPNWNTQRATVSEASVQRERGLIQAVFERAVDNDIIDRNPWRKVPKEAGEARNRLLTVGDEAKLLAAFDAADAGARWRRFVVFLLETGLRLDEALKVEPRDLTYATGFLHVHGKGKKRLTKCATCGRMGGKCRDVALTRIATRTLTEQWQAETAYWTQNESRYREVIAKAAERAKIPHLSPHDLRHTFGTRFLLQGGDIYTLSKILGHSSVAVTERHYAFLSRSDVGAKMLAVMDPKPVLSLVASNG